MVQSMKARFRDGVLEPFESLDLEDGDVVRLSIWVEESGEGGEDGDLVSDVGNGVGDSEAVDSEGVRATDFGRLDEMFKRIYESVPASAWDNVPSDGARNKKHYLYGHPKEGHAKEEEV